ncbi:hypothetical protein [Streptomyces sp. CB03911]|uniref:hypothetical protein n=1 Tax=Streptomyces sp. CB03911 TaxID=1804758 RepID=UPI00093D46CC|nr:hypothetical protein [Streptomyces sp. CB03911]OKI24389.1 hypothetical protein A6A07_05885 [Streptomyces sp. CB03911]
MSGASRRKTRRTYADPEQVRPAKEPYALPDGWSPLDDYDPSTALAVVPHTVIGCTCPGCRRGLTTPELRTAG